MTWKSLEARGSVTLSLDPHPLSAAALGCTGVGGGTSTLLLGPLDVWIYVMEQMVLLILTDLYRCPVCGVGNAHGARSSIPAFPSMTNSETLGEPQSFSASVFPSIKGLIIPSLPTLTIKVKMS